ncbi:MAG: hypothetical protein Q7R65_00430 [bacterium]|nr:hypothetical protein [bacterium]
MTFEKVSRYTINIEIQTSKEKLSETETFAKLEKLNTALGKEWAHLARADGKKQAFLQTPEGYYIVVGSKPALVMKIQGTIAEEGFKAQKNMAFETVAGQKKVCESPFQFVALVSSI